MECTQRLECTQELYSTEGDKKIPEQIGFLGICGTKYPLKKGPNKIGRDPQTCTVILKLNSISRQHALINVLNHRDFMLMDLDSANQTKLLGKTLQPYIPHPLHNGDTVQFGDIFGIFRLLKDEDEDDLPATQALNIPDTPVPVKYVSSDNVVTTIPESPDVSDRDDSFIVLSQPKGPRYQTPKTGKFIKPGKTISIQPVGTNKIDNIYWNSSKKSTSLNLDCSNDSLNDSIRADVINVKEKASNDIHEQETPDFVDVQKLNNINTGPKQTANTQDLENAAPSIHEAITQMPPGWSPSLHSLKTQGPRPKHTANTRDLENVVPSIKEAETQMPPGWSSSIHCLNTKMPAVDNLSVVCKAISPSIYTAETQMPAVDNQPVVCKAISPSIYTAETQMPAVDNQPVVCKAISPSIYTAETQMPAVDNLPVVCKAISPSIYTAETQMPAVDNLPVVCKINEQQDMQFDLCAITSNNSIYNAETQMCSGEKNNDPVSSPKINISPSSDKLNTSTEVVVFDEIDDQLLEGLGSQAILSDDIILPVNRLVEPDIDSQSLIKKRKCAKRTMRIQSDSSTDCDDIDMLPTQKIPEKKDDDDDTTDCDEEIIEIETTEPTTSKSPKLFEELDTQVIGLNEAPPKSTKDVVDLEDMPTQVIDINAIENDAVTEKGNRNTDLDFEDLPTQVLHEDTPIKKQYNTHKLSNEEENSPFKVPFSSPLKQKPSKKLKVRPVSSINKSIPSNTDDDKYYNNTQSLLEDLCSQDLPMPVNSLSNTSSVDTVTLKSPLIKKETSNFAVLVTSFDVVESEERVNDFVSNLSSQDIRDVIGVDTQVTKIVKVPSDGSNSTASDGEVTPKKLRPFKFMNMDLPNSQEIKTCVSTSARLISAESSSESEEEINSEEQCTPILFHKKKKKPKVEAKINLTKKFDVDALPSRVITRVRKPTLKVQDQESKKSSVSILKPTFLTDQDGDIDNEIITENIIRLKSNNKKSKPAKNSNETSESIKVTVVEQEKQTKEGAKTALRERDSRNKPEKHHEIKLEKHLSEKANEKKDAKRKIREPKNSECIDVNESSASSKSTKPSLDVEVKRSTRTARTVKAKDIPTKTKKKSSSPEQESLTEKPKKRKYTKKGENKKNTEKEVAPEPANKSDKPNTRNKTRKQVLEDKKGLRKETSTDSQTDKPNKRDPNIDKQKEVDREQTPQKEVWRSTRQRTVKDKIDESTKGIKSILKKSVPVGDESAVYSVSSGSDTPSSLKRLALDDSDVPSAKRIRSVVINNTSLRATPARLEKTHYVLFTAFPQNNVKAKLEKMGVVVVTDVMQCTVLLTQQIRRTFKLLCAVGLGKPIVGPNWVKACADANMIVDPWRYLIKDEETEKRFSFKLEQTLTGKRNFLEGYNVSSTPNAIPTAHEMRLIVECSGGTWAEGGGRWACVSVARDAALWPALARRGAVLVTAEFILSGVLRQTVEIGINQYK